MAAKTPASSAMNPIDFYAQEAINRPPPLPERPAVYPILEEEHQDYPFPPQRRQDHPSSTAPSSIHHDDPTIDYARDPRRLIAYLIPLPKPEDLTPEQLKVFPQRYFVYTPPFPPIPPKGTPGQKENVIVKAKRFWQKEVRFSKEYKESKGKTLCWKGMRAKAGRGVNWGVSRVTGADLDFICRIPGKPPKERPNDELRKLVLLYPPSCAGSQEGVRQEFLDKMHRTKRRAIRDAVIASALFIPAVVVDTFAVVVWPFGGLAEIDAVWAYCSIRGAKRAHSVATRISPTSNKEQQQQQQSVELVLVPAERVEVLERYLVAACVDRNAKRFGRSMTRRPTESDVLAAMGWRPSEWEQRNERVGSRLSYSTYFSHVLTAGLDSHVVEDMRWEDERWERSEVCEDLRITMGKAARTWDRWCKAYGEDPKKAIKK